MVEECPARLEGQPVVYEAAKMISDLVDVQIGQQMAKISASSPFLGQDLGLPGLNPSQI